MGIHHSGSIQGFDYMQNFLTHATHATHIEAALSQMPSGRQLTGWLDILTRGELRNGRVSTSVIKSVEIPWERTLEISGIKTGLVGFKIR